MLFKTQAKGCDLHAKIKRSDAQVGGGETLARLFEAGAKTEGQARSHFISALALLAQEIEGAAEPSARGKLVDMAGEFQQAIADQSSQRFAQVGNVLVKFATGLNDQFRGGRRGRSTDVSDEIGDGEIGFVADAGDHRNF